MKIAIILGYFVSLAIFFFVGYFSRKRIAERKVHSAEDLAKKLLDDAKKEAESKKRESLLEAKDELYSSRHKFEEETKERRREFISIEKRLSQREETFVRKGDLIDKKERELLTREKNAAQRINEVEEKKQQYQALLEDEKQKLQRMSGLSVEDARKLLLEGLEKEMRHETAVKIKQIEDEAKEEADKKAREIITLAIQRYAAEQVAEVTTSVVPLPSDELKGRIIGREGRNIKALEQATGVNLIIDDTPEAVTLSSFDTIRREVARITLERLISDGRIHPGRIEETVARVRREMDVKIREAGQEAVLSVGVHGLHPEEVKLLGKLKYRTSYGQNVLQHSIEVSTLAGLIASQIGMDIQLAKRAGFLHDIGKSVDHEVEGTHPQLGADIAKRYNESAAIVEAILNHHSSSQSRSLLSTLVDAADAISASRPGVRRETMESYVKKLEKLEAICDSYPGVEKTYAIQAGREVRVMVKPDKIGDAEATQLAREISKRIEKELEYPGTIKVTLIRETRVVDYAK